MDKFDFPMHPAQFIQLTSLVFIKASVLTYVPHYRWNDIDGKTVMQWVDPDVTFHWDDWDMPAFEAMYGEFLTRAGITPETVQTPDGRLPDSYLMPSTNQGMDPDGNFVAYGALLISRRIRRCLVVCSWRLIVKSRLAHSIVVTHHLAAVTANLVPLFKNDAQLIGWHGHVATRGTIAGAEAGDNEAEFVDRDATW